LARKTIGTNWDRENRNDLNHNFEELYGSTGQAIKAADEAKKQANNANSKANEASKQANYAKSQGDYAKEVSDSALLNKNTIQDEDTGKTYNWLLKQKNGHVIFDYEEA